MQFLKLTDTDTVLYSILLLNLIQVSTTELSGKKQYCAPITPENGQHVNCHHPENQNLRINCTVEQSPEYTVAKFKCDRFSRPKKGSVSKVEQVCLNEKWLREPSTFSCTAKCGLWISTMDSRDLQNPAPASSFRGQIFPWVVGVYGRGQLSKSHEYKLRCQGTLISPRAILTTSSCLTLPNSTVERRSEDIKIAAGQFLPNPNLETDLLDVEKIVLHPDYNNETLFKNVAVIWLKRPLKLTAQLSPVCLFNVGEATMGMVPALVEHQGKKDVTLISVNFTNCFKFQTRDEPLVNLCSEVSRDTEDGSGGEVLNCNNTNGAGLFTVEEEIGIWTLRGIHIGSIGTPGHDNSNCNEPLTFTDLMFTRAWVDKELSREPPIYDEPELHGERAPTSTSSTNEHVATKSRDLSGGTPRPKEREPLTPEPFLIPHFHKPDPMDAEIFSETSITQHRTKHSSKAPPPTTPSPSFQKNSHHNPHMTPFYGVLPTRFPISTSRHKPTTAKVQSSTSSVTPTGSSTSKTLDTYPGRVDDPQVFYSDPKRLRKCPPLRKPGSGIMQICQHDEYEDFDDCSNGGNEGTVATSKCKAHYVSSYGPSSFKRECMADGRWSNPRPLICHLQCGISARPRRSFIVNGIPSDRISWPWHATIFKKVGNDTKYICGGSLISKSLVLTAAHCVTIPGKTETVDKDDFRVVFASVSSNYTENLLDPISNSNLFYIKSVSVPNSYNGVTFDSDIGLLQLEFEVELSDYVKPVCFPFQTQENADIELLQLSPGTHGQSVGFGLDESGTPAITLREASLPVVSHRDCGEVLARFPSSTQFCAGYTNGTAVCNGDSGSGLFFSMGTGYTNRYIIQGIVSFGDSSPNVGMCNHETYAVFTKVSSFSGWVQSKLEKLGPEYSR